MDLLWIVRSFKTAILRRVYLFISYEFILIWALDTRTSLFVEENKLLSLILLTVACCHSLTKPPNVEIETALTFLSNST